MAMFVKLALLLITIRVFGSVHRKTIFSVYVLIGVIVAYYGSGVFIKVFVCWPIKAYWEKIRPSAWTRAPLSPQMPSSASSATSPFCCFPRRSRGRCNCRGRGGFASLVCWPLVGLLQRSVSIA